MKINVNRFYVDIFNCAESWDKMRSFWVFLWNGAISKKIPDFRVHSCWCDICSYINKINLPQLLVIQNYFQKPMFFDQKIFSLTHNTKHSS